MTELWKQSEGQIVDGVFHLRQYLGAGENSAVFLTEHGERKPRKAAIKLVLPEPQGAELQLSRWELAAKLSHPHLIRLFQMGRCQLNGATLLYVVMEYAEEKLVEVLPSRPLTAVEAREMLEPTLDALAYLHGKGFVHGHLKPTNILAIDDQLKISSDGLCRIGESRGGLAKPSVYAPPEIAAGVSPAGDVWSLGLTLVEALTQRLPVSDGMGVVLPEKLPAPFLDITRHCLQPDPQSRWTVDDIASRLRQNASAPQERAITGAPRAFWKGGYIVPASALGLAVLGILIGPTLLSRRPEPHVASSEQLVQPKEQLEVRRGPSAASPPAVPERSAKEAKISGRGSTPVEVVHQVLPAVPRTASNTIRGKVRVSVRVRVDPSGSVTSASLDSPGPSQYFARLAMQAAQRWKFVPAKVNDRAVASEWVLRFAFGRTETGVVPTRVRTPR